MIYRCTRLESMNIEAPSSTCLLSEIFIAPSLAVRKATWSGDQPKKSHKYKFKTLSLHLLEQLHFTADKPDDNNDILTSQHVNVYFSRCYLIFFKTGLKATKTLHKNELLQEREKIDLFSLLPSPGALEGYGFGFLIGNVQGFVFVIISDAVFWILIMLLKEMQAHNDK
jgi:hypothetical protein